MSHYQGPQLAAHEGWCSKGAPLVHEHDDSPVIDEATGEQMREGCTCGYEAQRDADRCTFGETDGARERAALGITQTRCNCGQRVTLTATEAFHPSPACADSEGRTPRDYLDWLLAEILNEAPAGPRG